MGGRKMMEEEYLRIKDALKHWNGTMAEFADCWQRDPTTISIINNTNSFEEYLERIRNKGKPIQVTMAPEGNAGMQYYTQNKILEEIKEQKRLLIAIEVHLSQIGNALSELLENLR